MLWGKVQRRMHLPQLCEPSNILAKRGEGTKFPYSLKLECKGLHVPVLSVCKIHGHLGFTVSYAGAVLIPGRGSTPYNGLYREAPPEMGTFFTLQVYERVRISRVEVYERVGKSIIQVFERDFQYFPMEGIRKGYHLSMEGIREGYLFCKK